ncbi:unnamed protein product [Phytophthora fragariaefolia]|uniref:Unnamed protein product n=1 Tax=Phytophthora fragariaefolia TaxID=1490495 RepID=A0A9W6XFR3_9STRA|nr:unnamed protein product [Phytophthora fragariaefolia]
MVVARQPRPSRAEVGEDEPPVPDERVPVGEHAEPEVEVDEVLGQEGHGREQLLEGEGAGLGDVVHVVVADEDAAEEDGEQSAELEEVGGQVAGVAAQQDDGHLVDGVLPQRRVRVAQEVGGRVADGAGQRHGADADAEQAEDHGGRHLQAHVRVAALHEALEEREDDDGHGVVQHALPEHEVEEQRRRAALLEHEQRGHGVDGRDERPVEKRLGRRELRDDAEAAEPEQHAARGERGQQRAHDGQQQDGEKVAEKALALRVEARLEDDGRQQPQEQDLRVQPGALHALHGSSGGIGGTIALGAQEHWGHNNIGREANDLVAFHSVMALRVPVISSIEGLGAAVRRRLAASSAALQHVEVVEVPAPAQTSWELDAAQRGALRDAQFLLANASLGAQLLLAKDPFPPPKWSFDAGKMGPVHLRRRGALFPDVELDGNPTRLHLNASGRNYAKRHGAKRPVFINVGRGDVIKESELVQALDDGIFSKAVLDVFETEPLPRESPLWTHPHVLITPHVSALSLPEEVADVFVRNLELRLKDLPMLYPVDWADGY